jgi:hypothetical protein
VITRGCPGAWQIQRDIPGSNRTSATNVGEHRTDKHAVPISRESMRVEGVLYIVLQSCRATILPMDLGRPSRDGLLPFHFAVNIIAPTPWTETPGREFKLDCFCFRVASIP